VPSSEVVERIDPYVGSLEELDRACRELNARIADLRAAIAQLRTMREEGRPVSEIVASGPGIPARREMRASLTHVNEALHAYRVRVVRTMVDEEGMSIAEVARLTGNARQIVSRLYHDR
jgi:hypothetical protein